MCSRDKTQESLTVCKYCRHVSTGTFRRVKGLWSLSRSARCSIAQERGSIPPTRARDIKMTQPFCVLYCTVLLYPEIDMLVLGRWTARAACPDPRVPLRPPPRHLSSLLVLSARSNDGAFSLHLHFFVSSLRGWLGALLITQSFFCPGAGLRVFLPTYSTHLYLYSNQLLWSTYGACYRLYPIPLPCRAFAA